MSEDALKKRKDAIVDGEPEAAKEATQELLDNGVSPIDIIKGMGEAMDVVGKKYEEKEYFVPDLVMAAEAMN